jgi:hypothetical protein
MQSSDGRLFEAIIYPNSLGWPITNEWKTIFPLLNNFINVQFRLFPLVCMALPFNIVVVVVIVAFTMRFGLPSFVFKKL